MTKKNVNENFIENQKAPIQIPLDELVNLDGLEYAHYVLQDRALVEVNGDGLKPVQRRILYSLYKMGSNPSGKTIKGSRVSGETIGKYHPHGPTSVEGAQENMGQAYKIRIPMFKVQGTLGDYPGDISPAARYYEIGINKQSWELVSELSQKSVSYQATETGDELEPVFLPVRFPYLLINGTNGIAVGYASNIPPHNPTECMDACIAFYKGKIKIPKDVLKYIKGPDLPTGGLIMGVDGIAEYFENGSGSFIMRGKYNTTNLPRGRKLIDFYELPYGISVENVIERINKRQDEGLFKEISEVKDLTDNKRGLSCAIYVKAGVNTDKVLDDLFKYTQLECKFPVNATALVNGVPTENLSILQIIEGFCSFRKGCFVLKTEHRLSQLANDVHKYDGLLAVLVDIDKAISIIRNAKDSVEASAKLIKTFKIDESQAEHILSMKLKQLTKADKNDIIAKAKELKAEQKRLTEILSNEELLDNAIVEELKETKKIIASDRKTEILSVTNEELEQQAKEQAKISRMLDKDIDCYISMVDGQVYKELELSDNSLFKSTSRGHSLLITEDADILEIENKDIPLTISNAISLNTLNKLSSKAISVVSSEDNVIVASTDGGANIIKAPIKDTGKLCQLAPETSLILAQNTSDNESIAFFSESGKIAKIDLSKIRQTRQGAGLVKAHSMTDKVVGVLLVKANEVIVTYTENTIKYTLVDDCPSKGRGSQGYQIHRLKKNEKITSVRKEREYTTQEATPRGAGGIKR